MARPCLIGTVFSGLVVFNMMVRAADWPAYRHDNARSGCTSESLVTPLVQDWVYESIHPPRPAWPAPASRPREGFVLRNRVDFDDAFGVVAVGDLVYFGSSADHKVYALDAATGQQRWSFFTGGPVRLAPTVWQDKVFLGSDDGFVYCLKADNGELVWKIRGGPTDEKLLGNGKMISRWPIRTGVLIDEEAAYFAAGIFPHENVYLYAVRAQDGTLIWKNDTISEQDAYQNDLSPQGYLLAAGPHLFVPSGRSLPAAFSKTSGQMAFHRKYGWRDEQAGGVIGGTYALLADDQIYTGTEYHLLALDQRTGRTGFAWFPGRRLTVEGNMAYLATESEILAMDRLKYAEASRRRNSLEFKIKTLRTELARATGDRRKQLQDQLRNVEKELSDHRRDNITPAVRWQVPSQCDAELIVCGNLVVAGGQDKVDAFGRDSGEVVWTAKVQGKARGLAVANGRLYVSTDTGQIYCFAAENTANNKAQAAMLTNPPPRLLVEDKSGGNPYPKDELTEVYEAAAEAILMETAVTKGYCLVVGAERGRLAYELARRTNLTIIGVEPDSQKVHAARLALDAAGLYGQRVTIDQGDLSALGYSNYFANLIVSDSLILTGQIPGDPARLVRHVKPCGGAICLGVPAKVPSGAAAISSADLLSWFARLELGSCRISQVNGLWATLQRGALPGAGKWTHQYAEPGNTACSDDLALAGPLGLLWFGEPGSAPMVNRHDAATSPLAVNGRLFIQGENIVMAYDSYNGMLLWKREIPGAMRTRLKARECGNLAASQDSFFIAIGDKCLRLDAATGETRATYAMPPTPEGLPRNWGYLAYVDGVLYGSAMTEIGVSTSVFAMDAQDGRHLWNYGGKNIANLTISIGDGWIFFVDSSLTPQQRDALLKQDKSRLANLTGERAKKAEEKQKQVDARLAVALDARTGGKLWEKPIDVTDCSMIGIGGGELMAMYRDGIFVLCGANANGHYWKQFLAGEFSQRRLVALSAKTGDTMWARDANYRHRPLVVGDTIIAEPWAFDLATGRQKTRPHPLTGAETTWQFLRPGHHCGAISACPQMLLMRSGYTSYYDLREDAGIRHFAGHRLGCWINGIAADGLALAPEASAGCICLYPIVCSLALEPRRDPQRWAIYSSGGDNTPVQNLAINFGAPGDRRDSNGQLWLAYPRPNLPADRKAMGFSLQLQTEFLQGGGYQIQNPAPSPVEGSAESVSSSLGFARDASGQCPPWVGTSWARGLRRVLVPLLDERDGTAQYTVTLYFADLENEQQGQRVFDIVLQGKVVVEGFDIVKESGGSRRTVAREFAPVRVERNLEIELIPKGEQASSMSQAPILCGLQVQRITQKTEDRIQNTEYRILNTVNRL
jgi:outer membrane protein assembly factor BamB